MADVESFTLDHTIVKAPYVRLIASEKGPNGDVISNFDLRFVQPNEGEIPTAGLHTLEHALASLIRDHLDGVIDISPFGCRTGFHLIVWGEPSIEQVVDAVRAGLVTIATETTEADVPGVSAIECGNYRDHSLHSAREWAKLIVDQGISLNAFERVGV
ncbi:S-ribosylhomocysteine lyase [Amnibacterium flavum]|uniref:S-ribosylhomocysteine lyase n=1 Tax=Amnibacterium flavum TaxID=2173173 RepID=A0A2V1HPC3_9MICO|nr:S-ribosylhomocysteine lyase [Amnibacterium flavum]PVZ94181.1 S-ribosylhomocysteine lyase [Amnibacterium flavum]